MTLKYFVWGSKNKHRQKNTIGHKKEEKKLHIPATPTFIKLDSSQRQIASNMSVLKQTLSLIKVFANTSAPFQLRTNQQSDELHTLPS